MEADLEIAVRRDRLDIIVPGLPRVDAQLFLARAHQQIPGAFDVGRCERLSVMPFDAVTQLESQILAILAPVPARREIGDDRVEAILLYLLVIDYKVIEYRHHRLQRGARRFLEDRHAGRAVEMFYLQHAAGLLRDGRTGRHKRE